MRRIFVPRGYLCIISGLTPHAGAKGHPEHASLRIHLYSELRKRAGGEGRMNETYTLAYLLRKPTPSFGSRIKMPPTIIPIPAPGPAGGNVVADPDLMVTPASPVASPTASSASLSVATPAVPRANTQHVSPPRAPPPGSPPPVPNDKGVYVLKGSKLASLLKRKRVDHDWPEVERSMEKLHVTALLSKKTTKEKFDIIGVHYGKHRDFTQRLKSFWPVVYKFAKLAGGRELGDKDFDKILLAASKRGKTGDNCEARNGMNQGEGAGTSNAAE